MQISKVIPLLKERWSINWKKRALGHRLYDLFIQFLDRLIFTPIVLAAAGAVMINVFGFSLILTIAGVEFLAVVYFLLLAIFTARSFDLDRQSFLINNIWDDLEKLTNNINMDSLNELRKDVDELTFRVGHS